MNNITTEKTNNKGNNKIIIVHIKRQTNWNFIATLKRQLIHSQYLLNCSVLLYKEQKII